MGVGDTSCNKNGVNQLHSSFSTPRIFRGVAGDDMIEVISNIGLKIENGGLFISRGQGIHPRRIIHSWELIFVESGSLSIREGNDYYTVGAGQCLILAPGKIHEGTDNFPADLKFFWIHFTLLPSALPALLPGASTITLANYIRVKDSNSVASLFRLFLSEQTANAPVELLNTIFLLILKKLAASLPFDKHTENESVLVQQAAAYIRTHYHLKISTSSVAAKLKCNPDYLGRLFRQYRGLTVTDEINQQRVKTAESLLVTSLFSLPDIATRCGFTDTAYFREIFKKYKGVTPKKWRALYSRIHINTH